MNRSLLLLFSMFALAFTLTACDSGGANESEHDNQENEEEIDVGNSDADGFVLDVGSFEATINDDGETLDISGGAVFGLATNLDESSLGGDGGDGEGFVIYLLAGELPPEEEIALSDTWTKLRITGKESEVPGEGAYEFETGSFSVPDYRNDMNSQAINANIGGGPGTFTITSASEDELEGTFSFENPGNNFSIQVEGSFTAVRTDDINTVICAPDWCAE